LDLLVTVDYTVSGAPSFDLIKASSISGSVGSVIVEGYSGQYSTSIVSENGQQILRLQLGTSTTTGTNYYISPNGDDTNDGLSSTNPFLTIPYALGQLSAGDTLNFMNGTYAHSSYGDGDWFKAQNQTTLFVNNLSGTSNAYITLRALPDNSPKIKGDGIAAIEIKNSSYIIVEGFEVEGDVNSIPLDTARKYQFLYQDPQGNDQFRFPPGTSTTTISNTTNLPVLGSSYKRPTYFNVAGISVKNSDHIQVKNNHVHHMPGEGIKSFDSDYLTISNNVVHDCSRRSSHGVHGLSIYTLNSIDTYNGVKVIIENNEVYDNYNEVYSWNQTKTFVNPHYDEGKGITIQRCYPTTGWTHGRILIRNNISYRNGLSGIQVNVGERIDILHNTVYGNHRTTEMYGDGSQHGLSIQGGDDINVKNNILQSWNQTTGAKVFKVSTNSTNITASHNIMVGSQDASSNVITSSPEFTDSTNFDFSLQSTSPAVDAGTSAGVTTDFNGNTRDASPDIGALEYGASSNCTPNSGTDVISACDSYTWIDGNTYAASNSMATYTLTNVDGCDSVVTLNLTINNNTGVDNITTCSSYTWIDGNTYTASNNTATYTLTNTAGCDSVVTLNLVINNSSLSAPTLSAPSNSASNVSLSPTLSWTTTAANGVYELVVSTDTSFNTIVTSQTGLTGNSFTPSNLLPNTTYYWRVGVSNSCAAAVYSSIFSFTTTSCVEYNSTNIPVSIPSSGTPTVTSTLVISNSGIISDLDVVDLVGEHTYISDLTITLTSPAGTQVTLFSSICNDEEDFDINFDDEASSSTLPCPPIGGGTYIPSQALSAFDGENIQGTWTLTISDAYNLDGGSLDDWGLDICLTSSCDNASIMNVAACGSYTWIDGNTYTTSNDTATYTLTNTAGCDSVVTLDLTINSSNTGTDVITACDSYTWIDGLTYTSSNNSATYTLTNASGCDSIVYLALQIHPTETVVLDSLSTCNSIVWPINNQTYSQSGWLSDTSQSQNGCDSIVSQYLTVVSGGSIDSVVAVNHNRGIYQAYFPARPSSGTYRLEWKTANETTWRSKPIFGPHLGSQRFNLTPSFNADVEIRISEEVNGNWVEECSTNMYIHCKSMTLQMVEQKSAFCAGDSALVRVGYSGGYGAKSILWSNGATTKRTYAQQGQTLSVTVTDASGCSMTDSITASSINTSTSPSNLFVARNAAILTASWNAPSLTAGQSVLFYRVNYRLRGTTSWTSTASVTDTFSVLNWNGSGIAAGNYEFMVVARINDNGTNYTSQPSCIYVRGYNGVGGKSEGADSAEPTDVPNISVYPNPTDNILYVQAPENSSLMLVDINGKTMTQLTTEAVETSIDMSSYAQGVYMLQIQTGDAVETRRIVRK
jgi:subtilisin-like proprotein convertase family protein